MSVAGHLIAATSLLLSAAAISVWAQNGYAHEPRFEVASIKPSAPGSRGPTLYNPTPTRFAASSITAKDLIAFAYNVPGFQISGGPPWLASAEYDIVAKPQGGANDESVRTMTRALLAERFNLKLHRDRKKLPVLALVIAKGGPKLQRSAAEGGPEVRGNRGGHVTMRKVTMETMAAQFASRVIGRPVIDRTGLPGEFDIDLTWTPDESPDGGPSFFSALHEQLGLKLEAQKGFVEILVIDHIEKPSAN